jgi:hypothetical protein
MEKTVWSYTYALKQFNSFEEASTMMKELANTFKQNVPSADIWGTQSSSAIKYISYLPKRVIIEYVIKEIGKNTYELRIDISAD